MKQIVFQKPILGLCAYSGSGKTTLLEKLIPIFSKHGYKVAVIKHAHHTFDIDHPEKDSYKIRKAGAQQILISSLNRWVMIHENPSDHLELSLQEALRHIVIDNIDFVVVEGYKSEPIPKIEIHRPSLGKPLISATDENVIAIATDEPNHVSSPLPLLELNHPHQIATYIEQFINKSSR